MPGHSSTLEKAEGITRTEHASTMQERGFIHWGDVMARFILVALFALLPITIFPVAWAGVGQGKVVFAGIALILITFFWAVARFSEGVVRIPRSVLIPLAGLLPVAYLVSSAVSGWSMSSVVGAGVEQDTLVAVVIWYTLFVLATLIFAHHRQTITRAVRAFAWGLCALFIFQALYVFFPAVFSLNGALQGATANLFGSWHDLGIVAGLSLFVSAALWVGGLVSGRQKFILIPLGLSALFTVLTVHFKDVFWGAGVLLVLGFLGVLRDRLKIEGMSFLSASGRAAPWFLGAVLFLTLGFFNAQFAEFLPSRIQINEIEVRPSWQGTFDVARQSLGAPRDLIFGAGPNSFIREWSLYKPQEVNLTPFWNSDFNTGVGIIPTSIFAVGALGLLAWAGIILTIFYFFVRFVREVRPLVRGRALFGITLAGTLYLVAYHMIYTPGVALTGVTFLFLALLAVCAVGDAQPRIIRVSVASVSAVLSAIFVLCVAMFVVFAAGTALREVTSNMLVNRAAFAYRDSGDLARAGDIIQSALSVSPKNDRAHRAAAELGVVQLAAFAQSGADDEAARTALQSTLEKTISHGLTAVELESNYQNWLTLAQIYGEFAGANVEGALENAISSYQRAFEAQPTNPVPKVRLAQIAIAAGDTEAARASLQEAVALKPDLAIAYYLLSQVEAAAGNGDAAITAAAQAIQLAQDDPLGWFNLGYIFYAGGAYTEAAASLERAATLAPDYANALFILGLSYNQLGRTEEAIIVLERVAALNAGETWLPQLIENVRSGADPFDGIGGAQ